MDDIILEFNNRYSRALWNCCENQNDAVFIGYTWYRRFRGDFLSGKCDRAQLGSIKNLAENNGYLTRESTMVSDGVEGKDYSVIPRTVYEYLFSLFGQDAPPMIIMGVRTAAGLLSYDPQQLTVTLKYGSQSRTVTIGRDRSVIEVAIETFGDEMQKDFAIAQYHPLTAPKRGVKGTTYIVPQLLNLAISSDCTFLQLGLVSNDIPTPLSPSEAIAHDITLSSLPKSKSTIVSSNRGLYNLGNTCFMDSALQCLVHSPSIIEATLSPQYAVAIQDNGRCSCVRSASPSVISLIQDLIKRPSLASIWYQFVTDYHNGNSAAIRPSALKAAVGHIEPRFSGFQQQDSHEFAMELLSDVGSQTSYVFSSVYAPTPIPLIYLEPPDSRTLRVYAQFMERRLKIREHGPLTDALQGLLLTEQTCSGCGHTVVTFEPFMSLVLPCPDGSSVFTRMVLVGDDSRCTSVVIQSECRVTVREMLARLLLPENMERLGYSQRTDRVLMPVSLSRGVIEPVSLDSPVRFPFTTKQQAETADPGYLLFSVPTDVARACVERPGSVLALAVPIFTTTHQHWVHQHLCPFWECAQFQVIEPVDGRLELTLEQVLGLVDRASGHVMTKTNTAAEESASEMSTPSIYLGASLFPAAEEPVILEPAAPAVLTTIDGVEPGVFTASLAFLRYITSHQVGPPVTRSLAYCFRSPANPTLSDCIMRFLQPERLDSTSNNTPICQACKRFAPAVRTQRIWRLPRVLIISLKRFRRSSFVADKITTAVSLEQRLDLRKFLAEGAPEQQTRYGLCAISHHHGTFGGGHYVADARDIVTGKWFHFDDLFVSSRPPIADNGSAYMMIYDMKSQYGTD